MNHYQAKPVLKNAIKWTGENCETIAKIIGKTNILGQYDTGELLLKTESDNIILSLDHWLLIESDTMYCLTDHTFKLLFEEIKTDSFNGLIT